LGIALAITGIAINPALAQVTRFHFEIDPKTPLKELLPVAPEMKTPVKPLAIDDLFEVPEVHFQDPNILPGGDLAKARKLVAHQIAKINFLNDKGPDQFVKTLLENRPDLAGLSFVTGDACRLKEAEREKFSRAVLNVREALRERPSRGGFWKKLGAMSNDPHT